MGDETTTPARARELVAARMGQLVEAAGSKLALASESGVSEGTVRNWSAGQLPVRYGTTTARKLDAYGQKALSDYPPPAGSGATLEALLALAGAGTAAEVGGAVNGPVDGGPVDGATGEAVGGPNTPGAGGAGGGEPVRQEPRASAATVGSSAGAGSGADAGSGAGPASGAGAATPALEAVRRPGRGPWPRLVGAVAGTLLAVAVTATLVVTWWPGGEDDQPAASDGVATRSDLTLDDTNMCGWRLGENPIPLASGEPLLMRIDARCNYPNNADPDVDPGATVYSVPSNDDKTLAVGRIRNNATFTPRCFVTQGDEVSDGDDPPNVSPIWIATSDPVGFVPNVNLGGGYTLEQLQELGLAAC